jgi:hypothetical protein
MYLLLLHDALEVVALGIVKLRKVHGLLVELVVDSGGCRRKV